MPLAIKEQRQASFLRRLQSTLLNMECGQMGVDSWGVARKLVIGHCIIAVEHTDNECDVYFACSMWMPKQPEAWGDLPYIPALERVGIGRIPGIGSTDQLRRVERARGWAEVLLTPVNPSLTLWEDGHEVWVR